MAWSRCYNSLCRHLYVWWAGERYDEETGLPHLAHVAWNALALLTYELRGIGQDDRQAAKTDVREILQRHIARQNRDASELQLEPGEMEFIEKASCCEGAPLPDRRCPPPRIKEGMKFIIEANGPIYQVKKVLVEHTEELGNQLFEVECVSHPELADQMMRAKAIYAVVQ